MTPWELPTALRVGDVDYAIRTDFRDVLYVLGIFADRSYEPDEQGAVCLRVMFPDWERIPVELQQQALEAAVGFIDMGVAGADADRRRGGRPRTVDWEHDGPLIVPAVNKVLGCEVRALEYLHWWTFLGAYMEIGESLFSTVLGIRQKRAKGKKLEKYEEEFCRDHQDLIRLEKRDGARQSAQRAELRKLFV